MQYNDVTFDHILTRGAVAGLQNLQGFAAQRAANLITVPGDSTKYKYFEQNNINVDDAQERSPGSHYKRINHNVVTKTINCVDYGLEASVDRKLQKELGREILQTEADILYQKGFIRMEKVFFETYFADASFDTLLDGDSDFTKWSDASSNPIKDIQSAKRNIARKTGVMPNTITCTADVADELLQNPEIIDRIRTDVDRILQYQDLARVFRVNEFIVSEATSSVDEDTEADLIDTKKLLIHHKVNGDARLQPASMLIAVSNTAQDIVGTNGVGIVRYYEPQTRSDVLGLDMNFDMVRPATYTGALFKDCIA